MTASLISRGAQRLSGMFSERRKRREVRRATRHLSGPSHISLGENEIALVSLVKNAAYYLQPFLQHYRSIGVTHFLFIDNGSTDGTPEELATEADVSVYSNTLPVGKYENRLRGDIAQRYVSGGWFLFSDSDELILPARGENRCLPEFAAYCKAHGYDGAVCQYLDLVSSYPMDVTEDWSYEESIATFDQYSLNEIDHFDYHDVENVYFSWFYKDNELPNADIKFMFGGIRREVFGEECCLTGHRFIRNASHIKIYWHPHCSNNLSLADFTFLIKHYKFAGKFMARDRANIANQTWDHGEDKARMSVLANSENFVIKGQHMHSFHSTDELIKAGFLACSARFLENFPSKIGKPTEISKMGPNLCPETRDG